MRVLKLALLVSGLVGLTACEREPQQIPELSFLDSLEMAPVLGDGAAQTVSPLELGLAESQEASEPVVEEKSTAARYPAPKPQRRRSSSSSASGSSGSGTYSGASTARQPRVVTVKNTKRDAVIGAGAGAVIGAVAGGPRNRVKGAVIGAVVGGAAGAVIGSTIDKSTRIEY